MAVALWTAGCAEDPAAPPPPEELSAAAVPGIVIGTGQSSRFAYVWANEHTRAINSWYSPAATYRYNGKGQLNRARRVGTGRYQVQFNGMAKGGTGTLRETLVATAYGNTDAHCTVTGWWDSGANLRAAIECTDPDGNYENARFTLLMVGNGSLNERYAFAWANLPSSGAYVPSPSYSFTTGGPPITIVKEDVWEQVGNVIYDNDTIGYRVDLRVPRPFGGPAEAYLVTQAASDEYTVTFAGLGRSQLGQTETVAVASLGAGFVPCGVRSWSNAGGNVTVRVQCRNPSGMLVNQSFVVLVIEG